MSIAYTRAAALSTPLPHAAARSLGRSFGHEAENETDGVHFGPAAPRLRVYPLDGKGARLPALAARDVERVAGGFRIHLQAQGQAFAPWYELIATQ